jgi:hypothetical protein
MILLISQLCFIRLWLCHISCNFVVHTLTFLHANLMKQLRLSKRTFIALLFWEQAEEKIQMFTKLSNRVIHITRSSTTRRFIGNFAHFPAVTVIYGYVFSSPLLQCKFQNLFYSRMSSFLAFLFLISVSFVSHRHFLTFIYLINFDIVEVDHFIFSLP